MYSELFEINSYKQIINLMEMYNLKKKYNSDYIMLYSHFLTQPLDNDNDANKYMKYKNILFDKHTNKVVSLTHKRISTNDQIQITNMELQNKDKKITEAYEGTLINMFYHNNQWNVSTTSVIDANECYWKCDKSILELVQECFSETESEYETGWESFCAKHNPEKIYLYTLIHNENMHLINYSYKFGEEYKKLNFVLMRNKSDLNICDDNEYNIEDKNVFVSEEYENLSALDDWNKEQHYFDHVKQIKYSGLIVRDLENENIIKLPTHAYSIYMYISRIKHPCTVEHYISLYQINMLDVYLNKFSTEMYYNNKQIKKLIHRLFSILVNEFNILIKNLYDMNNRYSIIESNADIYKSLPKSYKKMIYNIKGNKRKFITNKIIYYTLKNTNSEELIALIKDRDEVISNEIFNEMNTTYQNEISNEDVFTYIYNNSYLYTTTS